MIRLSWQGQLGNQLFQYCFARILAKRFGMELQIDNPYLVDVRGHPLNRQLFAIKQVSGRTTRGEPQKFIGVSGTINIEVDKINPNRPIILCGYFQNYQYYKPYKLSIKRWLQLPNLPDIPEGVLCVHFRNYIHNKGIP